MVADKAKFKVGDRVKCVENEGGEGQGRIGTVAEIGNSPPYVQVDFGDGFSGHGVTGHRWNFFNASKQLIHAPKFAVGDRVRVVNYPADYWIGTGAINEMYNDIAIVKYDDGKRGGFEFKYLEPVAVAPQQQPLTIRAGAYYRTRDGRKVGPMVVWNKDSNWPWSDDMYSGSELWDNDGRVWDDKKSDTDLIAEWTDEPAGAEFKVGDRVKFADDYGGTARGKEATVVKLNVGGDGKGVQVDQGGEWGISTEHAHSLRLVAEATSGKNEEPDAKLLVTISADTSALDAEIDRVLKRLRKLKRKARKLGIALEYSELRDAA